MQKQILEVLQNHNFGSLSRAEIMAATSLNKYQTSKVLTQLIHNGQIQVEGSTRNRKYAYKE